MKAKISYFTMSRIMIAEDSEHIRMLLRDILEIENHQLVAEVSDGEEAVKKFREALPDLLLLDLAMPRKDGISVLREIMIINPKAKVILITASGNLKAIQECIQAGASTYILKPFKIDELAITIKNTLVSEKQQ
jgi:two-component system chemotaxis response regulator CheY